MNRSPLRLSPTGLSLVRLSLAAVLLATAPLAQAIVFAINEGVTYRVSNEEILYNYPGLTLEDILACVKYASEILHAEKIYPLLT